MKHTLLILATCLWGVYSFGQNGSEGKFNEDFSEANLLMEEGYFNQALSLWLQLRQGDPSNANLNYKVGFCYLKSSNEKKKAQEFLELATVEMKGRKKFNSSNYSPFDPRERNAPVEAFYYLAEAYLLNYELEKSQEYFGLVVDKFPSKHHLVDDAERGLEVTANAKQQLMQPRTDITITNMGPVINSEFNDFSPVISVDENALFFTSRRIRGDSSNVNLIDDKNGQYYEDIYVSYRNRSGAWQQPELLNINESSQHSATINVSVDGQELFIYKDNDGGGDIYSSSLVGEIWSNPERLPEGINSSDWETHSAKSADGNTIYFVSDREGGFGGRDVYRCVKLPNGEWSSPLNLGPQVNTKYDEDAPFIHPDGKSLYFASKGHNSMGGFDIFSTRYEEDDQWSNPENVGYPINTVDDDVFYVTSADSRRAYFSSDRDGGHGLKDVYRVDLPAPEDGSNLAVLKGYVIAGEDGKIPMNTTIVVTDVETAEVTTYTPRARDGVFVAILEPCRSYDLDYMVDGRTIHTETIAVDCGSAYSEIQRVVDINPVDLGSSVVRVVTADGVVTQTEDGVTQIQTTVDGQTSVITSKDDVSVISSTAEGTAIFDKYFGYNEKDISLDESRFKLFINDVIDMINKNGSVELVIEGSASRVPTTTWKSNDKLADSRANDGMTLILKELEKRGVSRDKVNVASVQGLIQGPRYQYDFEKNRSTYEQFQYIRIVAK
jgi:hypothetical protein